MNSLEVNGDGERPLLPRFLAYKSDRPACQSVALLYQSLLPLEQNPQMTPLPFAGSKDLEQHLRRLNAKVDEVVLLYERPGTSLVWYKSHEAHIKALEIAWLPWVWGVGINPKLHEQKKIGDRERAAKSIRFTYGKSNFFETYERCKVPWGAHCEEIAHKISSNSALSANARKRYFRGVFSVSGAVAIQGFAGI